MGWNRWIQGGCCCAIILMAACSSNATSKGTGGATPASTASELQKTVDRCEGLGANDPSFGTRPEDMAEMKRCLEAMFTLHRDSRVEVQRLADACRANAAEEGPPPQQRGPFERDFCDRVELRLKELIATPSK